ncbi:MAG: OmpA family protein [Verrucomicrobiota bacterium]
MLKTLRYSFPLIIAALLLTGCPRKQAPTQYGNSLGDSAYGGNDLIPANGLGGDFGLGADGLEMRDADSGIQDGFYTDSNGKQWKMVEGILPSVYFGFDSTAISASERGKLQQAADYLASNPGSGLLIEGHCDWYGTTEYNLALGERRANSVYDYVSTLGASTGTIETLSKGSLESTSGLDKSQSSQDRRADLIILE